MTIVWENVAILTEIVRINMMEIDILQRIILKYSDS